MTSSSMMPVGGTLLRILRDELVVEPVLQVLEPRLVNVPAQQQQQPQTNKRYRMLLSDGKHFVQSMLLVDAGVDVDALIKPFTIVRLTSYNKSMVQNKAVVIVRSLVPLSNMSDSFGKPENVEQAVDLLKSENTPGHDNRMDSFGGGAGHPQQQQQHQPPQQQYQQPFSSASPASSSSSATPGYGFGGGGAGGPRGPIVSNPTAQVAYFPIASLTPYLARWTIKARVTAKSDMRSWSNARNPNGQLFNVDLLDADGGQIRATAFNETANVLFPTLQVGKVYAISNCQVKLANRKFSRLPHEYELTFSNDSRVNPLDADDASIEKFRFDLVPLDALRSRAANDMADVMGVVTQVGPLSQITGRVSQKQVNKRVVTIVDAHQLAVDLTLWGDQAEKYNEMVLAGNPVLSVKDSKISDYGGCSISSSFTSVLTLNPDHPEAHKLRHWYDTQGAHMTFENMSRNGANGGVGGMGGAGGAGGAGGSGAYADVRKTVSSIRDENLGQSDKGDYLTLRGFTSFKSDIERPPWYTACPAPDCKKKVTIDPNGAYECSKCNKSYPGYEPRYMASCIFTDTTGNQWLNVFHEQALELIGVPAEELNQFKLANNKAAYMEVFHRASKQLVLLRVRAKMEHAMDDTRLRVTIASVQPFDFAHEAKLMLKDIESY